MLVNPNKKKKKYNNPFFRSDDKKFIIPFFNKLSPTKIIIILSFFVIFSLIFLLFFSSIFEINKIKTEGANKTPEKELSDFILSQIQGKKGIFPANNFFFVDKDKLTEILKNNYSINFVEIKKSFPNKLIINFLEKEYALVWLEDDFYYYADKQGFLISEVSILDVDLTKYPLVVNNSSQKKIDKKIHIEYNKIDYIINLFNSFKSTQDIQIEKYIINDEQNTVIAKVVNGPELFFNINEATDKQISKLITVKNERIKDEFLKIKYVDLRIGDNVYYK